jgi:hypothetical protein
MNDYSLTLLVAFEDDVHMSEIDLTWNLELLAFNEEAKVLLNHNESAPIKLLLLSTPKAVVSALNLQPPQVPLDNILERLTSVACFAVALDDDVVFQRAVEALVSAYQEGFDANSNPHDGLEVRAAELWFKVMQQVYAIGGFLVRRRKWSELRRLTLQGPFHGEATWLMHGLVAASQTGFLGSSTRQTVSLLKSADTQTSHLAALHLDLDSADPRILRSISQFDALASVVVSQSTGQAQSRQFYPNFAELDSDFSTPVLDLLIADQVMQKALGLDNADAVRSALEDVLNAASSNQDRGTRTYFLSPNLERWREKKE